MKIAQNSLNGIEKDNSNTISYNCGNLFADSTFLSCFMSLKHSQK